MICRLLSACLLATGATAFAQAISPADIAADAARRAQAIASATPAAPWGCTVLLCLANPRGPTAIAQCVAPIRELWSQLRRGRPFPSCPMAQGPAGGAYARLGSSHYDECPAGTNEVPADQLAYAAVVRLGSPRTADPPQTPAPAETSAGTSAPTLYAGIGSGPAPTTGVDPMSLPPKVCAGRSVGATAINQDDSLRYVAIHEELVLLPPSALASFVDVILDRGDGRGFTLWSRVRY
jgi:hypothetical protein